jgi:WD40-like Beta Propeller Repeat
VVILCFFLSSCTSGQQISNAATPTIAPRLTDTPETATTDAVESVSTTPTLNVESRQLKDIVFSSCLVVNPKPPGRTEIPWIILGLRGIIPYAIDPNTAIMTDQLLPNPEPIKESSYANDFSVSPDGKWLAYDLYGEDNVSLVVEPSSNILTNNSQGRIIWHPSQPTGLEGWLTNESVILITYKDPNGFGSTLIRNPFNGEQHEFSLEEMPDSLDYQPGMSGMYLFAHSNLMPDPTLKRVAYPAIINHNEMVMLWDVENEKVITSLELYLDQWFNDPLWSPNGNDFLIMGINDEKQVEWFQVTSDGAIQELTYFGEFLGDYKLEKPSRSWDGRYLIFQLIYNAGEDIKYLILDLKSEELDGFCINSVVEEFGPLQSPVWSPDSRYVAITNGVNTENSGEVILVDVSRREAFITGKDVYAIGWILKP